MFGDPSFQGPPPEAPPLAPPNASSKLANPMSPSMEASQPTPGAAPAAAVPFVVLAGAPLPSGMAPNMGGANAFDPGSPTVPSPTAPETPSSTPAAPAAQPSATVSGAGVSDRELVLSLDPEVQLVAERLSFGPTPALVAEIETRGVDAFIADQLAPETLDDSLTDQLIAAMPTLALSNVQRREAVSGEEATDEIQHATLLRALTSQRQLQEIMVDFWSNHFNVYLHKGDIRYFKAGEDRDVIRPLALARFADLLIASAQSPAMLLYLDNAENTGANPNENYGREVLELHTVGVEAGYSEVDVRNSALLLTGWRVRDGAFEFDPGRHYLGPLQVLDFATAGANGLQDGVAYLDYLAHHPSTARRLARKLCVRFVGDDPSSALIDAVATAYLAADTAIVPTLEAIFRSTEFRTSGQAKLRRPFELLVGTLRALGTAVEVRPDSSGADNLRWILDGLGQGLFEWGPPTGYPDVGPAWLSADGMLRRWTLAADLARDAFEGLTTGVDGILPAPLPPTVGDWITLLAARLLVRPLGVAQWQILVDATGFTGSDPLTPEIATALAPELVAFLLSSQDAQVR